jgi:[acyl-carrier-protein] S-malonyltransferase
MVGYLFAGQGSQYIGMGKDLYEAFPQSKAIFDKADKILGFSLSQLCFAGPLEELTRTENCQPAILTVSIAAWEAFQSLRSANNHRGGYAAGLSLGEYSALVASGALKFEDAVYLVRRRGEFMEEAARKNPGKMLCIIGLELEEVRKICSASDTEVANLNCPGQIVISGGSAGIEKASQLAQEHGAKRAVPLEVSGAFHSSLMQEASVRLADELHKVELRMPDITFISNVTARPVSSVAEVRENLVRQVSSNVLWADSMSLMVAQGVTRFYEFGPGKVLKGLMRRITSGVEVVTIEKKEDMGSSFGEGVKHAS